MKPIRTILLAVSALVLGTSAYPAGRDIYPAPERAKVDLADALKVAVTLHKRVILDFGGNWCADCIVLDMYLHNAQNMPILESNFVLVHVNVGRYDANLDLAKKYEIPLEQGVPALAVLTATGKLLYSQKLGQFESIRRMEPSAVTQFLIQWKPIKPGCSAVMITC